MNYLEYDGMIFRVADLTLDDLKGGKTLQVLLVVKRHFLFSKYRD